MPIFEYRCQDCRRAVSVWMRRMGQELGEEDCPEFDQAVGEMEGGQHFSPGRVVEIGDLSANSVLLLVAFLSLLPPIRGHSYAVDR